MKPIIVANWKMNLDYTEVTQWVTGVNQALSATDAVDVIVSPASCYLHTLASTLVGGDVAAQSISEFDMGAYTGEVSAKMAQSCGAKYALLGHSERRHVFFETNQMIKDKLALCKRYGIVPILCVGETIDERNAGQVKSVISNQLDVVSEYDDLFYVAYEPVWAIGTGQTATPDIAEEAHAFIQHVVGDGIPILYGGSVNSETIQSLLDKPSIDGALIGGASLAADSFSEILQIVSNPGVIQ
ncbi:MAG: triose-phosphate isomerase [Candidatus Marinamargulisbacteria bacterium]